MNYRKVQPLQNTITFDIGGDPFKESKGNPTSWVVLDMVTTGMLPKTDRVIKVMMRRYVNGVANDSYVSLINPGFVLPKKEEKLTGIKSLDLTRAPSFSDIAWHLVSIVGNYVIVSHNAKLFVSFLNAEFERAGIQRDLKFIDTEKLAGEAFPGIKDYKLKTLIRKLNLLERGEKNNELSNVDAVACLYALCMGRANAVPESL